MEREDSLVTVRLASGGVAVAFAQALDEADWRADKIEFGAKLVLEETLVAEVQRCLLVREKKECRRRNLCLRDVVDPHGAGLRRSAALQVDFFLEPIVEDRGADAALPTFPPLLDERIKFFSALACFRGKKNNRRVTQKLQFSPI